MNQTDAALFDRWRAARDADAFAELLSRHASMVYGACLRVAKNPCIAEEVSQECFLELMKGPGSIRSIGAWLHTVATRRALDRVKAESRRYDREQAYAATLGTAESAGWDDTRAFVDEAIAELPDELQMPIVLRFLEGRTHEAIAEELGVPRSTVRSRIDRGIDVVRENLRRRGVVLATGTLATALESVGATPAPVALLSELGRRALAMRGGTALLGATGGTKLIALPVALAALVLAGSWFAFHGAEPQEDTVARTGSAGEPVIAAVVAVPAAPVSPPPDPAPAPVEADGPAADDEAREEPKAIADEEKTVYGWKLDLTPSEEVQAALQQSVNLEFQNIHIKEIIEFVQDSFDVNIVLDGRVVKPQRRSQPASQQQSPIAPGVAPSSSHGVYPGGRPPIVKSATDPQPLDAAQDPDDVDHGENYFPRDFVTDGMIRKVNLRDRPLEEALAVMTTMLNLTYKARGSFIWISSSSQITEDLTIPLPSAPFSEGKLIENVSARVNVEFEDIHISDMMDFLRGSFNVPIVIDGRVVMPKVKRGEESELLPTYTTDGMIDFINLRDVPMGEALFAMTKLLDLTYRINEDGIYISTPNKVREDF